jgi:hypothetical protein
MSKTYRRRSSGIGILTILIFIIPILLPIFFLTTYGLLYRSSAEFVQGRIEEKFVDQGNLYFVFYEDGSDVPEVLSNDDSLFFFKFNSADYAARIQPGQTYKFILAGWRIPFLSSFRNIIEFQIVD